VVCTGFSSIADTVVSGTPCVVYPFFSIQNRVAEEIDKRNLQGLERADSQSEVVDAVEEFVRNKNKTPEYENGAKKVAERVIDS